MDEQNILDVAAGRAEPGEALLGVTGELVPVIVQREYAPTSHIDDT